MAEGVFLRRDAGVMAAPFVVTAFLGAALIFLVQPMFARMATPLLGGAPAVWNVSLVCFQAALLGGYAYAHLLGRLRSTRAQVCVHALVLVAGFACLPLGISRVLGDPDPDHPVLWLAGEFAISIAPPFAALSATAPLIQHWYARSGRPDASDPYHLYAASNIGSLIGLAVYPLLIEPFAPLADQSVMWSGGYALLACMLLYAGWTVSGRPFGRAGADPASTASPTWRRRVIWLALSFAPSSLLVGATSHITTDIAAAPFLWAPPLMIYLVTFVIAFSKARILPHSLVLTIAPLAAAMAALMLLGAGPRSIWLAMGADLFALFVIALACHGALNAHRPAAEHLTQFYLFMSLGGVLGGAFNALLAPLLFDSVVEYPLMLVVSLALLSIGQAGIGRTTRILLAASGLALVAAVGLRAAGVSPPAAAQLALLAPSFAALISARRGLLGAAFALACAIGTGWSIAPVSPVWSDRSFFGVVRIVDLPESGVRALMHGTTIHGAQSLSGDRLRPRAYYAPETPIGQALTMFSDADRVGVVGLGLGGSACYSRPGQTWTFFEIDPLIVKVATDAARFTFMSQCQPDAAIITGDARIKLAAMTPDAFDLLLLDAFSSDSVPTHLLTVEAMQLYLQRLGDRGVLVFHISNRHLALKQVVARIASAAGARTAYQIFRPDEAAQSLGVTASEVVIVSRNPDALARAKASGFWTDLEADGGRPWTDDYSNIIGAMIERAGAH
ncbi:MAG: fused MFS/spermidine synthase [Alphaproteobacteria bacterium]|nr:fused MFS/spermidine synthase [Alphaproteobacteria bacterium]